ncbi:DUF4159 domain-containing protein [bacterium]|nr:DUF4159 domain-containing protein [bacterium]
MKTLTVSIRVGQASRLSKREPRGQSPDRRDACPTVARGQLWLTCLFLLALGPTAFAADRQLGTCGPPPRKSPQRQTSAEAMAPFPLPITPLRRSEPKAEPTAPLMIAKLEYGTTQDWNTDPGDIDNLMRHARYQLGLWYGWRQMNVNEVVASFQANKRCKVPILYISGHESFTFTDDQRAAVRQYVLDGGTLLGDACCGRSEFAASFRTEALKMFPDRAFDLLDVDHPVFRAFFSYQNVHYVDYTGGSKVEFQGPPQVLGLNVGCRTAVLLSPADLSCGWDEHTHERGLRLIPGDAIRLGLNLISYVAAERELGEVQAVTREIQAPSQRPRQQLGFAQIRHQGDWNPDPNSIYQLFRQVALSSSLAVEFKLTPVDPAESQIANYPFLYLTGHRDPKLTADQLTALQRHLEAGGFLFINNCCGRSAFDQAIRKYLAKMFPDQDLAVIADDDPLRKAFFQLDQGRDRQTGAPRPYELEGIRLGNRLVVVYSKNDAVTQLKQVSDPYGNGYDAESCRQLTLNIIAYALQN